MVVQNICLSWLTGCPGLRRIVRHPILCHCTVARKPKTPERCCNFLCRLADSCRNDAKTQLCMMMHSSRPDQRRSDRFLTKSLTSCSVVSYLKRVVENSQSGPSFSVLSAQCNEQRTMDGVEAGGHRLAAEISDAIANQPSLKKISLVGNRFSPAQTSCADLLG